MYLIFRSKDEWSWAGNENWIRRQENLLSIEGRVTAMALSNCGFFEILGILGTKLVFYTDSSFCSGDVMRFTRLHNEPLVCRRAREAGLSMKCTCVFCKVPTLIGLCFLVPLVELRSTQMIAWFEVSGTNPFKKVPMSPDRRICHAVSHEPGWVQTRRTGMWREAQPRGARINYPL